MPDGSRPTDSETARTTLRHAVISLRLLATTDLHMNLGIGDGSGGLSRLAPLIGEERALHPNVLVFDNGDLIEGTPLAEEIARSGLGAHDTHPAIAALNQLKFDAATLGNHDFSHGMDFLRRVLRDADYPITLANAGLIEGAPLWSESLLLKRRLRDERGQTHDITVGVFGVTPPQTIDWEPGLARELLTEDVLGAARRAVSALRARGADLIVALSHGGFGEGSSLGAENAAGAIAAIPGVDAVIAGHTHEVAIHPALPGRAPVVKAGFGGSHLAAITLTMRGEQGNWRISCSAAEALPAARAACPKLTSTAQCLPPGIKSRIYTVLGHISQPISSHYSLLGRDGGLRLIEAALRKHVAAALPQDDRPILTALAPFRTGGRGGPGHFISLPAGPLRRADLSTLYPFGNHVAAIELNGAELAGWLERAAILFNQLSFGACACESDGPPQLIDEDIPSFLFDIISGIDYQIDLSRPSGFTADGLRVPGCHDRRITRLRHRGRDIAPGDRFVLITNSYRLSGTPLYAPLTLGKVCQLPEPARIRVRDIIAHHLTGAAMLDPSPEPFFHLTAPPGCRASFETAPAADPALCPLPASSAGLTATGFQRLYLSF
ncbi:MAG: metallophosphoesterase [Paracoccus sp. (in: a-proteobacteria)]